ncbi:MAG: rhodanese-like domain-containing protein [Pseudomonadota bacterium]
MAIETGAPMTEPMTAEADGQLFAARSTTAEGSTVSPAPPQLQMAERTGPVPTQSEQTQSSPSPSLTAPYLLAAAEKGVRLRFPSVPVIESEALAARTMKLPPEVSVDGGGVIPPKTVLFDVREADEFIVSHLPGAIRVAPDVSAEEFVARYGDVLAMGTAVFYCSVGVRSAKLIEKLRATEAVPRGQDLLNLEGGIFRWHNENRSLVNSGGQAVDRVHRFDRYWGRMIARQHLAVGG